MRNLELKVAPGIVVVVAGALMIVIAALGHPLDVPLGWRILAAAPFGMASGAVAWVTVGAFRRRGTTVNPMTPERASALVTSGLYRRSRNPMYVGMLLGLLGLAILLGNPLCLIACAAFVLYVDRFQIGPEERTLRAMFGQEYDAYARRVRRWI